MRFFAGAAKEGRDRTIAILVNRRGAEGSHGEVRGRMNAGTRAGTWPRGTEEKEKERIDRERESTSCKKRDTAEEEKEEKRGEEDGE